MVSPAVERMASTHPGQLKVTKVNVDDSPRTAQRFDAMSIPTLLMVRDGRVVDRQVGAVPEPQLAAWVSRSL
jgi:thioredoxin 2